MDYSSCWFVKLAIVALSMLMAALFTHWNGVDAVSLPVYKDSEQPIETRVEDLLSRMNLSEKIGQMTQVERSVIAANPAIIQNFSIGSVMNVDGSEPQPRATATTWANIIDGFQDAAMNSRLGIPIIYGTDAVHGHNNVHGATIFPHNIGLGATRDPDLVRRIGMATALEVRATGMHYSFAPCIAVCRDPRWGRCYESYSEDTAVVRSMTEVITGLQGSPPLEHPNGYPYLAGESNVVACAKHFVGDGGTDKGINENDTPVDYTELYEIHMRPYLDALSKGISTIMASLSSWKGVKMHANYDLLTRVLKDQMGFQGFILSNWEGIDRITSPPHSNYTYSILTSINAGIDMVMVPYDFRSFINSLTTLVNSGEIPIGRINDAVRRILRVKFTAGLFENPRSNRSLSSLVGDKKHRQLAREAVRKSLVLLKNGKMLSDPLLPLRKKATKILVAGSHANNLDYQCGGWTISQERNSGHNAGTTILEAIQTAVLGEQGTTEVVFEENPDSDFFYNNGPFSFAIVVVGERPYANTNDDYNENLTIPPGGIRVIQNVCNETKCLVILISGRPLVVEPYLDDMDALVAAWLPGSEGQGVTDVIFGDHEFKGTLPRTWFRRVDQLPMNVGDREYDPLFPFGFGQTMHSPYNITSETP